MPLWLLSRVLCEDRLLADPEAVAWNPGAWLGMALCPAVELARDIL